MNHEGYRDPTAEKAIKRAGSTTTAKRYLRSIRDEQKEIEELRERIEELNAALLPMAIRYDGAKVQTSPSDVFSEKMSEIADYSNQLAKKLGQLMRKRMYAQSAIDKLESSEERQVLGLYFLSTKRLSMNEVADRVGYSPQHTFEIYRRGLSHVKIRVNQSTHP